MGNGVKDGSLATPDWGEVKVTGSHGVPGLYSLKNKNKTQEIIGLETFWRYSNIKLSRAVSSKK